MAEFGVTKFGVETFPSDSSPRKPRAQEPVSPILKRRIPQLRDFPKFELLWVSRSEFRARSGLLSGQFRTGPRSAAVQARGFGKAVVHARAPPRPNSEHTPPLGTPFGMHQSTSQKRTLLKESALRRDALRRDSPRSKATTPRESTRLLASPLLWDRVVSRTGMWTAARTATNCADEAADSQSVCGCEAGS